MRMPPWARRPRAWIGALLLIIAPTVAPFARDQVTEARAHRDVLEQDRLAAAASAAGRPRGTAPCLAFSDRPDFFAWSTGCSVVWVTREEYLRLPTAPDSTGRPVRAGDPSLDSFLQPEPAPPSRSY
jgi:hypothetical protein